MADGDLKEHALNSSHDFYELLEVSPAANESEIRRGYRKTALKYHPDKVGANPEALDKFHLLQIAYDVLLDTNVRQLYDNARRAREEKKQRESAYSDRRRQLKEDLERRESAGIKRKRDEYQAEEAFQQELNRLAADGARRRKEREEQLRREAQEEWEREQKEVNAGPVEAPAEAETAKKQGVEESDRTIKLRYPADTPGLDESELRSRFSRFGKIEDLHSKNKKIKIDGEKHRKDYVTAIIVFESIVGAHAAMTDLPKMAEAEDSRGVESPIWTVFENVDWLSGKEPDCIPKAKARPMAETPSKGPITPATERIKNTDLGNGAGLRKVPSFGSFKGTPKAATSTLHTPTSDEVTMMRLKNAERKRLAEKLRKEEEEADGKDGLEAA
ncbi:hypothetical protein M409DRAFT_28310 [Zasmidium cellare ATCC 36951]|uniref:J domain-containing protein n=1 Tax=Zasmidium cellare ATCC 36951 TaxID=1080233 RepID=A0A6A6C5W6_ZASCE|nr:uncharacterized protein M409DRAFT_28310 [Zasmidium cellare ATCC 36951]KAF2161272.1 hypothetical protein M409DRAFT_28310 [Zasmidium cellare ATCC 36951]